MRPAGCECPSGGKRKTERGVCEQRKHRTWPMCPESPAGCLEEAQEPGRACPPPRASSWGRAPGQGTSGETRGTRAGQRGQGAGTPEKIGQSCGPPQATAGSTTKERQPQREDRAALSHTTFSSSGTLMIHKSTKAKSQTKLSLERKEERN